MKSINENLLRSILSSVSSKYVLYVVQLLIMMLYARWFSPIEFGIISSMQVFVIFFMMFSEVGLGPAIINMKSLKLEDRNGIYTITILLGVFSGVVFYFFSYFLNYFFGRDDYQELSILVLITILFSAMQILPVAQLQREKHFKQLAFFEVLGELFAVLIVFIVAKLGYPLHAILSRFLTVSIVKYTLSYFYSSKTEFKRAAIGWKPSAINPILKFSLYQFGFNFLNYFSRNLDNILIGKFMSMNLLGVYDKSYALMKYPLQLLTNAMSPAIQPVISRHSANVDEVKKTHDLYIRILSVIGVTVGMAIHFNSEIIVSFMLGDKWALVSDILKILSLSIPIQVVLTSSGGFYQACGRAELMFKCGVFSAITNVIAIILGLYTMSLTILSWSLFVSFHICAVQCYWVMYRELFRASFFDFFKAMIPSIIIFSIDMSLGSIAVDFILFFDSRLISFLSMCFFSLVITFIYVFFTSEHKRVVKLFRG